MLIEFTAELSGLTANPTHGLSAQTGVVLTASATGFSGSAPRSVQYQWGTVESGEIHGATSATYMPDAAIFDGETLFCRVTPSDGYPATDTLSFDIRHAPPVAAGGLWDVVLDLGSADELYDVAGDLDPYYYQCFKEAKQVGVEILCYDTKITQENVKLGKLIEELHK